MDLFDHESAEGLIIKGCATVLWRKAWLRHVKVIGCTDLTTGVMPAIQLRALSEAAKIIGALDYASGTLDKRAQSADRPRAGQACEDTPLGRLLSGTLAADGMSHVNYDACHRAAQHFGECIGHMVTDGDLSWFDDHAHYTLLAEATHAIRRKVDLDFEAGADCPGCLAGFKLEQTAVMGPERRPRRTTPLPGPSAPPGGLYAQVDDIMRRPTIPPPK